MDHTLTDKIAVERQLLGALRSRVMMRCGRDGAALQSDLFQSLHRAFRETALPFGFLWINIQTCVLIILDL